MTAINDFETFTHTDDGQEYFKATRFYANLPMITGMPEITIQRYRPKKLGSIRDKYHRKIPLYINVPTPHECRIFHLINWSWRKFGAPFIAAVALPGQGKSNKLHALTAMESSSGKKIIMFADEHCEWRHLAWHGWFDKDHNFHPFEIYFLIPEGYAFEDGNYLWQHRPKNVFLRTWNKITDILQYCGRGKIVCIYESCFEISSRLQIMIDLSKQINKRTKVTDYYLVVHHELELFLQECPDKDKYRVSQDFARVFTQFRKDCIGLLAAFHEDGDVFYKVRDKFNIALYSRPSNKKELAQAAEDAKGYTRSEVNISVSGYFTKHKITIFPEIPDEYRLISSEDMYTYKNNKITKTKKTEDEETPQFLEYMSNPVYAQIWTLRQRGASIREIEGELKGALRRSQIQTVLSKLEEFYIEHTSQVSVRPDTPASCM